METPAETHIQIPVSMLTPSVIRAIRDRYHTTPELGSYRKPQPLPLPWMKLYSTWKRYSSPRARFAFAALYMTGQRVGEFIKTTRADVEVKFLENKPFIVVESITEKNRTNPRRSIPVPMDRRDDSLATYFWNHIKDIEDPEAPIWRHSVRTIWNDLSKVEVEVAALNFQELNYETVNLPIHAHYLRHCRATHLATDFGYGIFQLQKFFGWQSNSMPDLYASLAWRDLAKAFGNVLENPNSSYPEEPQVNA